MFLGRRKNAHGWNDKVTNELFLWKKLVDEEVPKNGELCGAQEEEAGFWISKVIGPFLESLDRVDRPSILDLGPVTNCNVSFYGEMGWKLYAYDLLQEYREAVEETMAEDSEDGQAETNRPNPIEDILRQLNYEPGSLSGILCWDVLDRLPLIWTRELVRRISLALDEGGMILSIFGMKGETEVAENHRGFMIRDQNRLEPIPDKGRKLERFSYENGEIMSLFSGFKVLNFYVMKNNVREVLVQKQPQASLKVSV